MTAKLLPHGLNEENLVYAYEEATSVADDANFDLIVTELAGLGMMPIAWGIVDEAGGPAAVGARTWTMFGSAADPADAGGFQPVSYDEATGTLTFTNRSGGLVAAAIVYALFAPAPALA